MQLESTAALQKEEGEGGLKMDSSQIIEEGMGEEGGGKIEVEEEEETV